MLGQAGLWRRRLECGIYVTAVPGHCLRSANTRHRGGDSQKAQLNLAGSMIEFVEEAALQLGINCKGRPLLNVSMDCVSALGGQAQPLTVLQIVDAMNSQD